LNVKDASMTKPKSGLWAKGCKTLGKSERMRVPLPAAKIRTVKFNFIILNQ